MISEDSDLPSAVQQCFTTFRRSGAFFYRRADGFEPVSSEYFLETIRRLALGLRALGLKRGDVVAVIAPSSPWWLMVDIAVMAAGGISTAVFPKISKKNLLYQLKDSDARFAYIDEPLLWETAKEGCSSLKAVVLRDVEQNHKNSITFNEVLKKGDQLSLTDPELYTRLLDEVNFSDPATIIYTSGSTGDPKGVILTHRNICSQIIGAVERYPLDPGKDRALSALPLAHCFERIVVYTYFCQGIPVYFADDVQKLKEYLPQVKPTVMTMVPRILEKLFARLQEKIGTSNALTKMIGEWGWRVAHEDCPHGISKVLADALFFKKIRAGLGGELTAVIVGGAPLDELLCRFFINAGIPVYQGYGLTETSPVLTANYPGHNVPGTVGPAFPGVEVDIRGADKEICCKGPNVMQGYHKLADKTAERFDEQGWFHTGDRGEFDGQGNLKITGRLTEMFKTSTGKFVCPIPLEQALIKHPLIDAAAVIAEGKSFVGVLIFAEPQALKSCMNCSKKLRGCTDPLDAQCCIMKSLQQHIDKVNEPLNEWEKIRAFRFITEEATIESGLLTPTMKLCRGKTAELYGELIDSMYAVAVQDEDGLEVEEEL
ncbi:AMP-dependent synthetase/ligase [Psychromonas aquimarina]|uniref:AMP-dependent synthetase/ligase n=1 Tax=Psychromonas aquimarina TaxID=444919 RepID=UPI0003FC59FE|nr:AMP-binding protein [Psychromonas aquimarina]